MKTVTITIDIEQAKQILAAKLREELDRPQIYTLKSIGLASYDSQVQATFEASDNKDDPA